MRKLSSSISALVVLTLFTLHAPSAQAGIEACGDIRVEAEAECVVEVEGGCVVQCEPVAFTAACSGELRASCSGECDANVDVSCTAECQGGCEAECEIDPGSFDCEASCSASCEGDCSAECEASGNRAAGRCLAHFFFDGVEKSGGEVPRDTLGDYHDACAVVRRWPLRQPLRR